MSIGGRDPPYPDGVRPTASRATVSARLLAVLLLAPVVACSAGGDDRDEESDDVRTATDPNVGTGVLARCFVSDPDGELILHPGAFRVRRPVRLDDVELIDPVNVDVIEGSVVDYTGPLGLQGVVLDYPPLKNVGVADYLGDWETRRAIPGLQVTRADGKQAVLVAIGLVDPAEDGHLRGVRLLGTSDGHADDRSWEQLALLVPHDQLCTVERIVATREWTR